MHDVIHKAHVRVDFSLTVTYSRPMLRVPPSPPPPRLCLYSTAALFNSREMHFNIRLNEVLAACNYDIFVPQRDGFEFAHAERLKRLLAAQGITDPAALTTALERIIYLLDLGYFIGKADAVVANLDEPIDEGVVVEIQHARVLGKPVVGWRTEERSPFGSMADPLRGCHFFPAYQCDVFIHHSFRAPTTAAGEESIAALAARIHESIISLRSRITLHSTHTPATQIIRDQAEALFGGLADLHSDDSMEEIARRYARMHAAGGLIGPVVVVST